MPNSNEFNMIDDRVASFVDAHGSPDNKKTIIENGFVVEVMSDFDTNIAPANQDTYHMFSLVGQNASNTNYHHKFADVTVFMGNTSPYSEHDTDRTKRNPYQRYIIVVDAWTGKRIKIELPEFKE